MKISIITVVRNASETIADAIESVVSQDYAHVEYVVIDGVSTDGTLEVLRRYANYIDVFVSEPDRGLYDAVNKGISLASGDVVGLMHADDVLANISVLSSVAHALRETGSDAAYGDLVYISREGDRVIRKWQSSEFDRRRFRYGWMPPHPTLYLRRCLFERLGGYDLSFGSAADYELMLRYFYRHQVEAVYVSETLTRMRVGGASNQSIRGRLDANRQDRRAWEVNNLNPAWYLRYLKPLRKVGQYAPLVWGDESSTPLLK